jgi:formylglycine-generating enzyme required for sulfatase activity
MIALLLLACTATDVPDYAPQTVQLEDMILIEAATYDMGRATEDAGPYGSEWKVNEMPQHMVSLESFHMDRLEVTVADWADFLNEVGGEAHHHPLQPVAWESGVFSPEAEEAERPIRQVSWYDAATFCAWAGKRLPTEAEWEYAAKGEEGERWPWGASGLGCEYAVYFNGRSLCEAIPAPVGEREDGDSPFGVADMAGNVAEWVWDRLDDYSSASVEKPMGAEEGLYRVIRGGGFRGGRDSIRSTHRIGGPPARRSEGVGFRCAHSG